MTRRPLENQTVRARVRGFFLVATLVICACSALMGCCCDGGTYHIGPEGLYSKGIRTVFVPIVEADTYRAGFAERLTEAICKKFTEQTPYQLASAGSADSILSVKLVAENQTVTAYNRYDDTRQKNVSLVAVAVWRELNPNLTANEVDATAIGVGEGVVIDAQSYLVPEMGQSTAVAQQEAIEKLAAEIVNLMETAW